MALESKFFGGSQDIEPDEPGHLYQLKGGLVSCTCGWSRKLNSRGARRAYGYFEEHEALVMEQERWHYLADEEVVDETHG